MPGSLVGEQPTDHYSREIAIHAEKPLMSGQVAVQDGKPAR